MINFTTQQEILLGILFLITIVIAITVWTNNFKDE